MAISDSNSVKGPHSSSNPSLPNTEEATASSTQQSSTTSTTSPTSPTSFASPTSSASHQIANVTLGQLNDSSKSGTFKTFGRVTTAVLDFFSTPFTTFSTDGSSVQTNRSSVGDRLFTGHGQRAEFNSQGVTTTRTGAFTQTTTGVTKEGVVLDGKFGIQETSSEGASTFGEFVAKAATAIFEGLVSAFNAVSETVTNAFQSVTDSFDFEGFGPALETAGQTLLEILQFVGSAAG